MKRILICTTALALVPTTAWAQEGENGARRDQGTIYVTAERRAEDVQDTPISIVALSGDSLRERGVDNLQDLTAEVPSFSFVDNGLTKFINIRGIGVTESAPNQTVGVAVHQDGAYIARELTFGDAFFDLESVQILRGPQGTYSGQNASGGAVFIESARPDLNDVTGYAQFSIGDYTLRQLEAAVSVPLSQTLAVRIAGKIESRNSFYTNFGDGSGTMVTGVNYQPGDQSNFTGRAQVLWAPSDTFEARVIHQYGHLTSDGLGRQRDTAENRANPYILYYNNSPYGGYRTVYHRTTGQAHWDPVEAFRVNAVISYQKTNHRTAGDYDYTNRTRDPGVTQNQGFTHLLDHAWSGELTLVSMDDGPFEWTVGGVFLDYGQDGDVYTERDNYSFPPIGVFGLDQQATQMGQNIFVGSIRKNQAVFAEVGYQFTDDLQIKVGARYNHERNGFTSVVLYPVGGLTNAPPGLPLLTDAYTSFNDVTGRVLVNWTPNPDHLVYATVSRGYKPGGLTGRGQRYGSEVVTNWEAGWKGDLADGALQGSVSVFWMDYDGFQATVQPDPQDPTTRITDNVDNTRIKGFEAQLSTNVDGLRADISASYVDATYGDLPNTIPPGAIGNPAPIGINLRGRQINYAPKFSINGGISYDIPVGEGRLTPSVRASYQGRQWVSFFQLPYHEIGARTLVDARLTYSLDESWTITGYVTNLFDEVYETNVSQTTDGVGNFLLGAPRQFGVTVAVDF